ncbi:MAG: hypothetical protein AB8B58_14220 [Roseobacter sp.]
MGATTEQLPDGTVEMHDGAQFPASSSAVMASILEVPPETA